MLVPMLIVAALDVERFAEHLDNPLRQRLRSLALVGLARLNDRELVAAEPSQYIRFPQQRLQTRRHFDQQRVAGGMAERIVDLLEPIEVQEQNGERFFPAALARGGLFDFLYQGCAVGKPRQCVMVRQEGDALLRFLAFRDVLDNGDEVFCFALTVLDDHATGRLHARTAHRRIHLDFLVIDAVAVLKRFGVGIVDILRVLGPVDVERGAIQHFAARNAEHGLESPIDEKIFARFRVLHDDGDRNVLDNRIEKSPGFIQLLFRAPLFGNVDMRRDPAAVGHRPVADRIDVAVAQLVFGIIRIARSRLPQAEYGYIARRPAAICRRGPALRVSTAVSCRAWSARD